MLKLIIVADNFQDVKESVNDGFKLCKRLQIVFTQIVPFFY